jgi:hypothetical protein
MTIVRVKTQLVMRLTGVRQLPFATAKAINTTAETFQKAQRAHQRQVFTVRRPAFVDKAVKIKPFARKGSPFAVVRIDPPGGKDRADVLTQHEEGGSKLPAGRSLTVPELARRTKTGVIGKAQRPRAFGFELSGKKPLFAGDQVFVGKHNTLLIRKPGGKGVIIQGTRRKGGKRKVLYILTPRARLKPQLEFTDNATRIVKRDFARNLRVEWLAAMRTAR